MAKDRKAAYSEVVQKRFAAKQKTVEETSAASSSSQGTAASRYRFFGKIPVGALEPNPDQPRKEFSQEELKQLAASIEEHGLLQPISVIETEPGGRYQIIAGERRWRAFQLLGREEIEAIVYLPAGAPKDPKLQSIIENTNRVDLSPVELAEAVFSLFVERELVEYPEELRWLVNRLRGGHRDSPKEKEAYYLFEILGVTPNGFRKHALGTLFWPEELREDVRNGVIAHRAAKVVARAAKDAELYETLLQSARAGASESELRALLREERAKKEERAKRDAGEFRTEVEGKYYQAISALKEISRQFDPELRKKVEQFVAQLKEELAGRLDQLD